MTTDDDDPRLHTGPFANPLADWPNDDLMMSAAFRERLKRENAPLFAVLDWPELRTAFERHNEPAGLGKRVSRLQGLLAIGLAGAGIILIGAIPALPHHAERTLSLLALGAMGFGGLLGLVHWLVLRSKSNWLGHRFWTERLRHLYFQSLVNNLELAARALADPASLDRLKALRHKWLDEFYVDVKDPSGRIRDIVEDRAEVDAWLRPEWHEHHTPHGEAEAITTLLDALRRQRIGIQIHYAGKNLGSGIASPRTRAEMLHFVSAACTVLVVVAALVGAGAYALETSVLGMSGLTWSAVAAVLSAVGLAARAANEGMENEADTDRYEWYKEAVEELRGRYDGGKTIARRVQELRRLEEIAYQELRRFLHSHSGARFLM